MSGVFFRKFLLGFLRAMSLWLGCTCANADALLDFTMFTPPPPAQRKIAEPVMGWVVRADPKAFCDAAQPKDGMAVRPEGCVVWQRKDSRCTIATTERTTHSQLGHLFLLCMKAE